MSYHDRHSGRYYSPSPPPFSRRDTFLENLDRGRVKDAVGALMPGARSKSRRRHDSPPRHSHHHHRDDRRRSYEDDLDYGRYHPSDEDYYYRDDERRSSHRHHHHHHHRHHRHRDGSVDYYYYKDEEPHRGRRRGHSVYAEPRDHYYYSDSDHHRGHRARSAGGTNWRQATEAAVGAGLIEGWRSRRDGDGVSRIATAAAGAAGTAMLVGRENDRRNTRHVTEATLGGLMLDRVVNGRRKR